MRRKKIEYRVAANGCHICTSHRPMGTGYPQTFILGKNVKVMRHLWKTMRGDIPNGLSLMHSCDNRMCINLYHLRVGTHKENVHDMIKRGRAKYEHFSGEQSGSSKLTEKQAINIKYSKTPPTEIAREYGVTYMQVWNIRSGRQWRHI